MHVKNRLKLKMFHTTVSDFNKSELKLCGANIFFPTQNSECCVTEVFYNYEQFASSLTMYHSFEKVNRLPIQFEIKY